MQLCHIQSCPGVKVTEWGPELERPLCIAVLTTTARSSGFGSIQRYNSWCGRWHLMIGRGKSTSVDSRHGQGHTRTVQTVSCGSY